MTWKDMMTGIGKTTPDKLQYGDLIEVYCINYQRIFVGVVMRVDTYVHAWFQKDGQSVGSPINHSLVDMDPRIEKLQSKIE